MRVLQFVDKIVAAISPKAEYMRETWRQAAAALRGYDAANNGRLNSGWNVFNESAEQTNRFSRDKIRARARDLERNSDIAQSVIQAFKRNVVGKGYTLQAKSGNDEINNQLESLWRRWCRAANCDVAGAQSFNQLIRMAVVRKKVDGGILFVKRYTRGGLTPFKLQLLEVDELDTGAFTPRHAGNKVMDGVEYDAAHRAVGYFFRQYDVDGWQTSRSVYVSAKDVIPYWSKTRPSQLREISDMAPVITRVRDANEFITAVTVAKRVAACLAVFIKRALPSIGGLGRNDMARKRFNYDGRRLTPGMISELNVGDSIDVVEPKGTGGDAADFVKMQWGLIGAGQGLSYEAVSRDMNHATYSSARQAAIEDESAFTEDIELLCEVMSEIYETFVISCYLAGLLQAPDFFANKEKYLAHYWVKAPKKWIDPAKEAAANKIALQTGQKTFADIAAEQGKDWKEAIIEMAEVIQFGREQGIDMGGVIFGTANKNADKTANEK